MKPWSQTKFFSPLQLDTHKADLSALHATPSDPQSEAPTDGCWGGGFGGGSGNGSGGNGGAGIGGSPTGGAFCRCLPAFTNPHLHPLALKCRLTSFSRLFQRTRFSLKQNTPRVGTVVGSVTRLDLFTTFLLFTNMQAPCVA